MIPYRVIPSGKIGLWHVMKGIIVIYEDTFEDCCGMMIELARLRK